MNDFISTLVKNSDDPRHAMLYDYFRSHIDRNDAGHRMAHVNDVAQAALAIGDANGLTTDRYWLLVVMAALGHDHTCYINRETHHLEGASRTSLILAQNGFSIEESSLVACMIAQHRASYKGTYTNTYAEVFAAADRGAPDLDNWLRRSVQYWVGQGHSAEEGCQHALEHIPEKYGRNGYARYPSVWKSFYKNELIGIYDRIDALTIDDVNLAYVGSGG